MPAKLRDTNIQASTAWCVVISKQTVNVPMAGFEPRHKDQLSLPPPTTPYFVVKIFSDRLTNWCHRCDTKAQNNLVYAQRIPVALGADPLSQDRQFGVFGT